MIWNLAEKDTFSLSACTEFTLPNGDVKFTTGIYPYDTIIASTGYDSMQRFVNLTVYDQLYGQIGNSIAGEASGDLSGNAVDISADSNIVAIGAYRNNGGGANSGHTTIILHNE